MKYENFVQINTVDAKINSGKNTSDLNPLKKHDTEKNTIALDGVQQPNENERKSYQMLKPPTVFADQWLCELCECPMCARAHRRFGCARVRRELKSVMELDCIDFSLLFHCGVCIERSRDCATVDLWLRCCATVV